MLSFEKRQGALLFSFIGGLAFLSSLIGLVACFMVSAQSQAGFSRQTALHYIEQARHHQPAQVYSLYQLSEKKALKAVTLEPFQAQNWQSLSDVLMMMGKHQEGLKALKIARIFDGSGQVKAFSNRHAQLHGVPALTNLTDYRLID